MSLVARQWFMLGVLLLAVALVIAADVWASRSDVEATYSRMAMRSFLWRTIAAFALIYAGGVLSGHLWLPQVITRYLPCPHCPHCAAAVGVEDRKEAPG
jgi:hypothetical protein